MKTVINLDSIAYIGETKTIHLQLGGEDLMYASEILTLANELIDDFYNGNPPIWAVSKISKLQKNITFKVHGFNWEKDKQNSELFKLFNEINKYYINLRVGER